ncbi:MAG: TVP38/TMEM64 family protein [Sandaracinaceae bacterium]
MLKRVLTSPGLWLTVGFLVGVYFLHGWVQSIGGPAALGPRFGLAAPAIMVVMQALLAAAPFPSELFALVSAATYGWMIGTVITWAGWTLGSMIQYALARRSARDLGLEARLARMPAWLRKLGVTHPVFLVVIRWLPLGFHVANLTAGAYRVPVGRQLAIAAIGSVPLAIMWSGIGAGLWSLT